MAYVFGSQPLIAAFMMAFRFSNLLRRLLGEGALQAAFIPHFEGLKEDTHKRAATFFRDLSIALSFFLILLICLVEAGLWGWLIFANPSVDNREVIILTAIMFPSILFICLYGLNSALLQCEGSFFTPSVAPIAFNVFWILTVFYLKDRVPSEAIVTLGFAIVGASFFQWLMTVPKSFFFLFTQLKTELWKKIQLKSQDIKTIARPLLLSIVGVSAAQINNALDPLFAWAGDREGPAYLWYALRIQQLPLALFGIAFAAAMLPALSRHLKAGETRKYIALLSTGLKRCLSLMLPCTFAIFVLGLSGVNLLFGRGDFSSHAVAQTTLCLWAYGLGIVPQTLLIIFASALYAQKAYGITTANAFLALVINCLLNALFIYVFKWPSASVALATSLAAGVNFAVLVSLFFKGLIEKHPSLRNLLHNQSKELIYCLLKLLFCCLLATGGTVVLGRLVFNESTLQLFRFGEVDFLPSAFWQQLIAFAVQFFSFLALFWGSAYLTGLKEVTSFFSSEPSSHHNAVAFE